MQALLKHGNGKKEYTIHIILGCYLVKPPKKVADQSTGLPSLSNLYLSSLSATSSLLAMRLLWVAQVPLGHWVQQRVSDLGSECPELKVRVVNCHNQKAQNLDEI